MDVYEALYTTRAMRRCKPDPIPIDAQQRILDAAIRAPTGGNTQNWRFMLVDDTDVKTQLGPIYRTCLGQLWETIYKDRLEAARADPSDPEMAQLLRIQRSAQHLADHFEQYPLLLFSFVQFDPTGGSIFPATWSAMLAARAEGIGSSLTSPRKWRAFAASFACAMFQPAKLLLPTYTTLPCCTRVSIACHTSSQGAARSMWCIWYRSM